MKLLVVLALFFIATQCIEVPSNDEEAGVVVLTDSIFDTFINENQYALIEFYAPWCGHCKQLVPEWQKAAFVLKDSIVKVPVAKIDSTIHKTSATKYGIKGFPTIKFFIDGKDTEYNGGRTGDDIIKWVQKRTGDYSRSISDAQTFDDFVENNKVGIVYFASETSGANWETWKSLAQQYEKLNFAHISDASIAAYAKAQIGTIVLYKQFDELKNIYSESVFNSDALRTFIDQNSIGTIMEFDDLAVQAVFHKRKPAVFFFNDESVDCAKYLEIFTQVAVANKGGDLIFTVSTPSDGHGQWTQLLGYLRFQQSDAPFMAIVHATPSEVKKNKLEGDITVENLQNFVDEFNGYKLADRQQQQEKQSGHTDL